MNHLILAYAVNDALPLFTQEDLSALTHINLAFGLVKDGLLDLSQLTHLDCRSSASGTPRLKSSSPLAAGARGAFLRWP